MTNNRFLELEERVEQQLLPGIPDEISINYISTKLPWRAIYILSSVSTGWRHAIRSREVYDARVRSQSETLVVHSHCWRNGNYELLCLYSVRDKRCYELPEIPMIGRGIPWLCQCATLDGKIYVLGGTKANYWVPYPKVYVLDLAVGMEWKECASMEKGRQSCGCGVVDGKVYVFGGGSGMGNAPVNGVEVYNPKTNAWSTITPMAYLGCGHRVDTKGDELLVHSGKEHYQLSSVKNAFSLGSQDVGIYHPGKNEWRLMNPIGQGRSGSLFMLEGQFYLMTGLGIDVHDADNNAWENLHVHSLAGFGSMDRFSMALSTAALVNDELFVKTSYERNMYSTLMKSKGFRSKTHAIVWSPVICGTTAVNLGDFIFPIQL